MPDEDIPSSVRTTLDALPLGVQASPPGPRVGPGTRVGRYVLVSQLGHGGMGVVHAAYDPDLDRKVALKLLRAEGGAKAAARRMRLLREAQALARLNHPNVVTVHDVGTVGERVFIAMEFVEGMTLAAWCRASDRRWPAVVDVMLPAGRGLAAAHAAGLLHRDFKPDNVMVGVDGCVRVMDFGLARARAGSESSGADLDLEPTPALAIDVTQVGTVVGTPAFMAPEQFAGHAADESSDQYAFCVTLWEALYGAPAFDHDTVAELAATKLEGRIRRPPSSSVPKWLRQICERGLCRRPADRFASLDDLLAALEQGRARVRRRRALAIGALVVAVGAGALVGHRVRHRQRVAACEAQGARIEQVWDQAAKGRVTSALRSQHVSYADATAAKVIPWIDDYAEDWRAARTEACLRHTVHETWEADLVERARWCLDDRWIHLQALITDLERGSAAVTQRAVFSAADLAPSAPCLDATVLARQPAPPPPGQRETISALLAQIATSDRSQADQSLRRARAVMEEARALGWEPLVAQAHFAEAIALRGLGEYSQAVESLERAYEVAASSGAWDTAARAAQVLVHLVGYVEAKYEDGERWAVHARVASRHAGDPLGLHDAVLNKNLANVNFARGDYDDAERQFEHALRLHLETLGPDHPLVSQDLSGLGAVQVLTGRHEQARVSLERALTIKREAFGPEHPAVADALNNLGGLHHKTAHIDEAIEVIEQAMVIRERAFGPDHIDVAESQGNLALLLQVRGDLERAHDLMERALATKREVLGPRHPHVAMVLNNLASLEGLRGDHARRRALHAEALAIREASLPEGHQEVEASVENLGHAELALGHLDRAEALFVRLLALRRDRLAPGDPKLALAQAALGRTEYLRGRVAEGMPRLAQAVSLLDGADERSIDAARVRLWLAQGLVETGGERERATVLIEQALAVFEREGREDLVEEAERWAR